MRTYWGSNNRTTVQNFARHATSLPKLQQGLSCTKTPRHHDKTDMEVEIKDTEAEMPTTSTRPLRR